MGSVVAAHSWTLDRLDVRRLPLVLGLPRSSAVQIPCAEQLLQPCPAGIVSVLKQAPMLLASRSPQIGN